MKIEVVERLAGVAELREEWEALHAASENDTVFASWTWCDTWLRHFPEEQPFIVLARDDGGTLAGIAPMLLRKARTRGGPLTYLAFIGASAPVEHFDFIVRDADVLPPLLEALKRPRFDVLELGNILPHSPSLPVLRASGLPFYEVDGHASPVLHLPPDMDAVYARQEKKKSERARYYLRRIERDYPGRWSCDAVRCEEVDGALDALIRIHQGQWQERGQPGAFADARLTAFYRELARRLCERGWLRMYRLVVDGKLVSANLAIVYRGRFLHFVNGTDYSVPVQSPGVVLHAKMIERSIGEGVREYDFMWGEEPYKYDWGAELRVDRTLIWARSVRARLFRQARRVWRAVKKRVR